MTDTRMIAISPSQNCGIAWPITPNTRITLSTQLPRRSAAITPSGMPITSWRNKAVNASCRVAPIRSKSSARAGWW